MSQIPSKIKALILDMDGVLWKADAPIGDLAAIFRHIESRGLKVVFATNNGSRTAAQYVERLAGFGVRAEPWQIVTSAMTVAHLVTKQFPQGGKIFAIGETGVREALTEKNFELLHIDNAEEAQAVVVGIDRQITFEKMREATLLVRAGKPFFATNPDKTFPTPRGEIPGAGAWLSVIITATDVQPTIAGKPFPYLLELALERLGTAPAETLVVGDRLETDIQGGQAIQCPTALVLSGVSTEAAARAWTPQVDIIAPDLATLVGLHD
jgi:4-nitrophenyl phosphatase